MHRISNAQLVPRRTSCFWLIVATCIALAALSWLIFGQTFWHDFINYDDPRYVYENTKITGGLRISGIAWAFTHIHSMNWHPLTTISHMLDCQLYGLKAGWHHFTNVLRSEPYWQHLAQRLCCRGVRYSPFTRGIRCLDSRAKGCA